MSGMFKPSTTVVQAPSQQASSSTGEVRPYKPVEPYIQQMLPALQYYFAQAPQLYQGSLVPGQNQAQQQAQQQYLAAAGHGGVAGQVAQGVQQGYQGLLTEAMTPATQSAVYQAQVGDVARQARALSEQNKLNLQQQAIQAGQYGLGSTALGEQQTLQQRQEQELAQQGMSQALQAAEGRRMQALGQLPQYGTAALQAGLTPASIYEAVGSQQAAQEAARLADQARLATQEQEAIRTQLVNLANLYGGLAGLGSQTQLQTQAKGTQGIVVPQMSSGQSILSGLGALSKVF